MATTVMPVHDGLPELHPIRFERSESAAIKEHLNEHGVSPHSLYMYMQQQRAVPTLTRMGSETMFGVRILYTCIIHATAACWQLATFLQQSSLSQVRVRNFSTQ